MAHPVDMTTEPRRLTGAELEAFFEAHKTKTFDKLREEGKVCGFRINAYDNDWSSERARNVPPHDLHVYRYEGTRPLGK